MKKILTLLALTTLCVASVNAQTISDDFNDNSLDAAIWRSPQIVLGNGQLLEQGEHVEFTTTGAGETEIEQGLMAVASSDKAWQMQMVASMSTSNFSAVGDVGTISIVVGSWSGDHWLQLGYGAGILASGVPVGTALVAEWSGGENITPMTLPTAIGIRLTHDPQRHLIQAYFNLDAGLADGEWTLFESFTIDGSPNPVGTESLDWGDFGGFWFTIGGWSSGPAIAAGSAWGDDFAFQVGPVLTGFNLWASAIPNAEMRGDTDDASGNGIPNLLQYVYGLDPLATDTDVKLRIEMNGGVPEMIHGFNATATDYSIDYQEKQALNDGWSGGLNPTPAIFQSNGKTFRRVTLPAAVGNKFLQLEIIPQL